MKKYLILTTLALGFFSQIVQAQTPKLKIGNNPTTINSSAAIEIESTNKGLLVSRLTSTQRDAISAPAAGLFIYNTSNNTFEVYKASCSCWVTVNDGGNTESMNVENTAPTVGWLNYSNAAIVDKPIAINFKYEDLQNDPQGATTVSWQVAENNSGANATTISGATTATYTPVAIYAGKWIRAVITPRATAGVLNGVQTFGSWINVESNTISTATNLVVTGTPQQGSLLTGTYTFAGGSGTENTDATTGSSYLWQTARTISGENITNAPLYGSSIYIQTYTPQSDLLGRFIRMGVRARDNAGLQAVNFVNSPWVGPITIAENTAPTANNVTFSPAPSVNLQCTGVYSYNDVNNDPEGTSTFQWYRADDVNGTNKVAISGATNLTYTPSVTDAGKYIGFGVTPKAQTGTLLTGTEFIYYHPAAVLNVGTFNFTASNIKQLPFFSQNALMGTNNDIEVEINVTQIGGIQFTSNTVNGYNFTSNFTATSTGTQWITLTALGTLTNYNQSGDTFTITGVGTTTNTKSITIENTPLGSSFTNFANNNPTTNEFFSNNSNCSNSLISANKTVSNCSGSVAVGTNSYPLVLINGQCWMQTNLKENPTAPCAAAINTGCNVWLATTLADMGSFGYYNTVTTNGSAGWATSEPAAKEGLLYQWSAAMNNSTIERAKGVCPTGFHIPSDCEFMYLEHGQGMAIAEQVILNQWRSNTNDNQGTPGYKLRSQGTGQTNTSGFSALLAGTRSHTNGAFFNRGEFGVFWTSSATATTTAYNRYLATTHRGVGRENQNKGRAYSVRCIKD